MKTKEESNITQPLANFIDCWIKIMFILTPFLIVGGLAWLIYLGVNY